MNPDAFDAAAYVDRAAPALGLALAPAYRLGVIANLARTAELARLVMEFPLTEEAEIAPVFAP